MRQYLLTDQERAIIRKYLETGEKLEGFKMLLSRCRHMESIHGDLQLINEFLGKAGEKQ